MVNIILCIPGRFSDASGASTLRGEHDGLAFKRTMLIDRAADAVYLLRLRERDPRLRQEFVRAARQSLEIAELAAIGAHTQVAHLVGTGGSIGGAGALLRAGAALLNLGGAAIMVESSGLAHGKATWLELAAQGTDPTALYRAYVGLISNGAGFSSCGMHNLGLPDAAVTGRMGAEDAATLLEAFLIYLLTEHPTLRDGHAFGLDAAAPAHRLRLEDCTAHGPDDPCYNPFGVWRLGQP